MKNHFFVIACCLLPAISSISLSQTDRNSSPQLSARQIFEKASRSIVLILTKDREGEPIAQGTGFFIAPDLVVTNLHVLRWAFEASVKPAGKNLGFMVDKAIAFDLKHDRCILSANTATGVPMEMAQGDSPKVGDEIYVIGNPKGLESSFSKGIVSGLRNEAHLIQIDAPISPGSSGGPVLNARGQVIGVVVSTITGGQNLNFAIPIEYAESLGKIWDLPVSTVGSLALRDLEADGLTGPVKSVLWKESSYALSSGKYLENSPLPIAMSRFDSDGDITEQVYYKEGRPIGRTLFEYDEAGFVVRQTSIEADGRTNDVSFTRKDFVSWKVAANPLSTSAELGHKDDEGHHSVHKYDSFGNEIEMLLPSKSLKWVKHYDDRNRETEEQIYEKGLLTETRRMAYKDDENGNWITQNIVFCTGARESEGCSPSGNEYREIEYYPRMSLK